MRIRDRDIKAVAGAVFQKRHYRTLLNMIRTYREFPEFFARYLLNAGRYPRSIELRTPTETVTPKLYSYHDLLTVNEIFCREDYPLPENAAVIVDIGSNIGISALYFLSRSPMVKCHLFEPVPSNVEKLKLNLSGFETRFSVTQMAAANRSGVFSFGVEDSGRYGGLHKAAGKQIDVRCCHINEILKPIVEAEGHIDVLKLDIEGSEEEVIEAIGVEFLSRIGIIYYESAVGVVKRMVCGSDARSRLGNGGFGRSTAR